MRLALTIGFVQLDVNSMGIPPQIAWALEHYGIGILVVMAVVFVCIGKEVSTRPGQGK